jgi:hypothetical protein
VQPQPPLPAVRGKPPLRAAAGKKPDDLIINPYHPLRNVDVAGAIISNLNAVGGALIEDPICNGVSGFVVGR